MLDCAKPVSLFKSSEVASSSDSTIEIVVVISYPEIVLVDACQDGITTIAGALCGVDNVPPEIVVWPWPNYKTYAIACQSGHSQNSVAALFDGSPIPSYCTSYLIVFYFPLSVLPQHSHNMPSMNKSQDSGKDSSIRVHIPDLEKTNGASNDAADISADLETRITRKLDRRLMPWLFGLWLLAFIDRANIGNAKIDGMIENLGLDSNKFNIALAIFYVPYILWDVPSNLVIKHLKAGYYLPGESPPMDNVQIDTKHHAAGLLTVWGLVSMCSGFVKTYAGLLVARFFLGLAEGGLLGGLLVYLAMFYRRHQMLYRVTLFYCAAPLSGAFGGLLATGLAQIHIGGYNGWVRF